MDTDRADARVTVLMPVRTFHPEFLERALASLMGQTSPRWRLLVIDDGADGGLGARLAVALEDDRVRLTANERRGFARALNTGLRQARTDFVSLLFADDMWAPNVVELLTSHIVHFPDVDFFHGSRAFIDSRDRTISSVYRAREDVTLDDFATGGPVKHPLCWRRELGLAIGGMDESLDPIGVDDYDFPWSMAEAGARFMAVPDCVHLLRDHRESFRLTTHVPLNVHVRALRRIHRKHGASPGEAESIVDIARRGYLRQCLYRSPIDRWLKERLGRDPRRGYRESYR